MVMFARLTFVVVVCLAQVQSQGFNPPGFISDECFNCLCEASSNCNLDIGCNGFGTGGQYFCGPYQISYNYWQDAGSPGAHVNNPLDFEMCLNNRNCAEGAIRGYMGKWLRDCDRNEKVDCNDVARVHMGGPQGCNSTWVLRTDFWTRFKACYPQ